MSVDEAVSIIITSGIATNSPDGDDYRELTDEELAELGELAGRAPGADVAQTEVGDGGAAAADGGPD